jgi:hypothetical protein
MDKKQVNDRVIIAINYILKFRPDISKSMLSELLELTPTSLSHILGSRMNVGVEVMTALCLRFQISADWLLTGRGNMVSDSEADPSLSHMGMVMQLVETIKLQAEDIGKLKARINQLEAEAEIKRLAEAKNIVEDVKNTDKAKDNSKKPRKRKISKSRKKNIKVSEE